MKDEKLKSLVDDIVIDLRESGFRITRMRKEIVRILAESNKHLSAEEIYFKLRTKYPRAGYATVYRALRVLTEEGITEKRDFRNDVSRYEIRGKREKGHHDHIVCIRCGKVVEFAHKKIEALQREIAKKYGFIITDHRMELYGLCGECQKFSEV